MFCFQQHIRMILPACTPLNALSHVIQLFWKNVSLVDLAFIQKFRSTCTRGLLFQLFFFLSKFNLQKSQLMSVFVTQNLNKSHKKNQVVEVKISQLSSLKSLDYISLTFLAISEIIIFPEKGFISNQKILSQKGGYNIFYEK
jgi:hypothetical protein